MLLAEWHMQELPAQALAQFQGAAICAQSNPIDRPTASSSIFGRLKVLKDLQTFLGVLLALVTAAAMALLVLAALSYVFHLLG